MRPVLLDVNVLVAMFDSTHPHHMIAHNWFSQQSGRGWRTCPITENGLLRILSNRSLQGYVPILEIAASLETAKKSDNYEFWPDSISLSQWISEGRRQIATSMLTDAYLLRVAESNGGALATFDRRIDPSLIGQADQELVEQIPF